MFHNRPALRVLNETAWRAMLWGITAHPAAGLDNWIEGDPGVGLDSEPEDYTAECWHCEREFIPSDASGGIDGYDLCPTCMRRQSDRENR